MADRARDLTFAVLSDLSRLDLDDAARDMEQLGDKGHRALDRVDDAVRDVAGSVRDFNDDTRTAARRIGDSFDSIKDASRDASRKMRDDFDDAGKGLDEFKDEARSSGREAAASFGGGFEDVGSFIQETAANAFGGFGPIGAAAGIAAAAGIGIITKVFGDSKEKAEEAKAAVGDWVQAFIDGQGKIQASTIEGKITELLGDPDKYREIIDLTDRAHVSAALFARALAGDAAAAEQVSQQMQAQSQALAESTDATAGAAAANADARASLEKLGAQLGQATGQMRDGRNAWQLIDEATRAGITAEVKVTAPTERELRNEHAEMQRHLGQPVAVPVKIDAAKAAQIAWLDADKYFRAHPITLRTKGPTGQRPIRDIP